MISTIALFLAVAITTAAATAVPDDFTLQVADHQKAGCGERCQFRLCRATGILDDERPIGTRVLLRDSNIAAPPFLCLPGTTLGKVRATGTAMVAAPGQALRPVNKLKVSPRLSKDFFGLRRVKFPVLPGKFGITHLPTKTKQWAALNDLCVVIPVRKYDIIMSDGSKETINTNKPTSCVSFTASAPRVLIEFTWDSSDDFDLVLLEPGTGEEVSKNNFRSAAGGKLNKNNNVDECDIDKTGKEQISYIQGTSPPSGEYTVRGLHFNNCGNGPTNWNIAVVVDGVNVLNKSGKSDLDDEAVAFEFNFTI